MGDWIPVEVKKKSFTGLFLKYIMLFCIGTLMLVFLIVLMFDQLIRMGLILPANYAEAEIEKNKEKLAAVETVTEKMIPYGTSYGVYDKDGEYLYGTIELGKDSERAWDSYKAERKFFGGNGFYSYIMRDNGEICIVKYYVAAQFSERFMGKSLPNPVLCVLVLFTGLFLAQTVLLSRHFSRELAKKLKVLRDTTESIQKQDLEFEHPHSDVTEIEEILDSLCKMKEALSVSLEEQWDSQRKITEQVSALAHDIKTPLTIIKGNTELISEEDVKDTIKEYSFAIGKNVKVIEDYLKQLSELLKFEERELKPELAQCAGLAETLAEQAQVLAAAQGKKSDVTVEKVSGGIRCDVGQMIRAWDNIVMNGLSYTPKKESVNILIGRIRAEDGTYLFAEVKDKGPGFTKEALCHAAEKFYQGDRSRHCKDHKGIGLYIASGFAVAQGGKLTVENAQEEGYGGKVTLYIRMLDGDGEYDNRI